MNNRKQHVIKMAHQLFIDKGFQATSIQDILEYSGISKGTFYNYFSSKNELLMALFNALIKKMEKDRNELLIGQNPSDIDIFIKQIELQITSNITNKLISLFEEVVFSNDLELREFIKKVQLKMIGWLYQRFIDIFGENHKPYLLDCAVMFQGVLQYNLRYNAIAYGSNSNTQQIVRYSVKRVIQMVDEVAEAGDYLLQPELLDHWLPNCKKTGPAFHQKLQHTVLELKKGLYQHEEKSKYIELLDFIHEELLHSKEPRKFLIECSLKSLKTGQLFCDEKELQKLEQLLANYFMELETAD